jgi:hypothetical protein
MQDDRYEPLPGLLSLPAFLYRKLGLRGRMAIKVGGGMLVVAITAAVIVLAPRISESRRERSETERREAAAALAEQRRRLAEEQRPHRAQANPAASRAALIPQLEGGIMADVRARVEAGKLSGPAAKRVECEPFPHGQDPKGSRVVYDCLAVTSDLPSTQQNSPKGAIGHWFRGVVDFSRGRLTWCKVSGRPVGDTSPSNLLPPACSP